MIWIRMTKRNAGYLPCGIAMGYLVFFVLQSQSIHDKVYLCRLLTHDYLHLLVLFQKRSFHCAHLPFHFLHFHRSFRCGREAVILGELGTLRDLFLFSTEEFLEVNRHVIDVLRSLRCGREAVMLSELETLGDLFLFSTEEFLEVNRHGINVIMVL